MPIGLKQADNVSLSYIHVVCLHNVLGINIYGMEQSVTILLYVIEE